MTETVTETGAKFTSRDLRGALSSFATGVTIVTTRDLQDAPVGMTASSFNSVSMDPPLILWSVTKTSLTAPAFEAAEHFAVHILASDQIELSNRFATRGEDKFGSVEWHEDENRVPILEGACVRFDCKTWNIYDGGDHLIIVGEVLDVTNKFTDGLVFSKGAYATANAIRPPTQASKDDSSEPGMVDDTLIYHLSRAYRQVNVEFHRAVAEAELSVAEWRILATLYGPRSRGISELPARTFVDPDVLEDILGELVDEGLVDIQGGGDARVVSGTQAGHDKVSHLFDLAHRQETEALAGASSDSGAKLKELLQTIIENTN
jgi:flavin reductase (DIM6/NTAB) family NADH-FMN oxidoreductase RutF/DNA-binding MarR family transcriptional regulator